MGIPNQTGIAIDKDTRAMLQQLAVKEGLPVWQYVKKLAMEKLGKSSQGVMPGYSPLVREEKLDVLLSKMAEVAATTGEIAEAMDILIQAGLKGSIRDFLNEVRSHVAEAQAEAEAQGVSDRKLIPNEEVG
jgi:hypothetical protein